MRATIHGRKRINARRAIPPAIAAALAARVWAGPAAEWVDPSVRLDVEKRNDKDPIVEMMGDQGRKTIFYTDGNKPDTPAGVGTEVVDAKWDGLKLVSNAPLPKGGTVKRTYEVSPDGTQLWEEVEMIIGKDKNPSKFRFVYDAVAAGDNY